MDPNEPHRRHADDVVASLGADRRRGLTDAEARSRLERHGHNELAAEKATPAWVRFLAQFRDVLVILLLIATGISAGLWAYERDPDLPYEAMAILAVVLFNALLGYVQQARAEAAVAALRAMSAADAAVIRNGERRSIPAAEIVPGDIILIEEGALSRPTDGCWTRRPCRPRRPRSPEKASRCPRTPMSSPARARSVTATTWCSAARQPPTDMGERS
jgi:Ca2+-transporting ATPase